MGGLFYILKVEDMEKYKKVVAGSLVVAALGLGAFGIANEVAKLTNKDSNAGAQQQQPQIQQVQQLDQSTQAQIANEVAQLMNNGSNAGAQQASQAQEPAPKVTYIERPSEQSNVNVDAIKAEVEASVLKDVMAQGNYTQREIVTSPTIVEQQPVIDVESTYINGGWGTMIMVPPPLNEVFVVYNPTAALILGIIDGACYGYNFPIWYNYCPTPYIPAFYQPWNTWEYWGGGGYYGLPNGNYFNINGGYGMGQWGREQGPMPWHRFHGNRGGWVGDPARLHGGHDWSNGSVPGHRSYQPRQALGGNRFANPGEQHGVRTLRPNTPLNNGNIMNRQRYEPRHIPNGQRFGMPGEQNGVRTYRPRTPIEVPHGPINNYNQGHLGIRRNEPSGVEQMPRYQMPRYQPPQMPHYQMPRYQQPQIPHYQPPQMPHYQMPRYQQPQMPHYQQPQMPHENFNRPAMQPHAHIRR